MLVGFAILVLACLSRYFEGRLPFVHRIAYAIGHVCSAIAFWKAFELLATAFIVTSAQHFDMNLLGALPPGKLFLLLMTEVGLFTFAVLFSRPAWAWAATPFMGGIHIDSGLLCSVGPMTTRSSNASNDTTNLPPA
ncbi:MAG: hypothetical protein PW734_08250 [Verrucomicrobium sp.]|nr:hypothetical protein [Verrucomicrobium sp.]